MCDDPKKIIQELRKKLKNWEYKYYILDNPDVEDEEYDLALKKLFELEKKYPQYIVKSSPTQTVGGIETNIFKKVNHRNKMLSLKNAFNINDLLEFDLSIKRILNNTKNFEYYVEPKIDGISVALHYNNGKFIQGVSRGNGLVGEDITENLLLTHSFPLEIKNYVVQDVEVRGELYISSDSFMNINKELELKGEKLLSNPRNAVAGTIRQLNKKIIESRKINFIAYDIVLNDIKTINKQQKIIKWLKSNGFETTFKENKLISLNEKNIKDILIYFNELRTKLNFSIDGIVFKLNDLNTREIIGNTSKFPRWAIAYKFPAEVKQTKVIDIFATIGRTGRVSYNILFDEVTLLNTKVKRATLHNYNYIKKLELNIGDIVNVKKAGDIIPKVISVSHKNSNSIFQRIEYCPSCKSKFKTFNGEVDQYCVNDSCPERLKQSVIHFSSREAMNIDGLAEKQIELFIQKGFIKDVSDIYLLKNHKKDLFEIGGYREKSINNLIEAIDKSKSNSLEKVLFGLGIRYIGKITSLDLAKKYKNIDEIISLSFDELEDSFKLGMSKSKSIVEHFKNSENVKIINKLKDLNVNFEYISQNINKNRLNDKNILVTGKIDGISRSGIHELLKLNGANILTNPTKNIDLVIVGSKAGENKLNKIDAKIERKHITNINELQDFIKENSVV